MILSVSRRSDIPAFYTEWFFNRLKEGYVLVRNPMNYHQVSKITLNPSVIDCIVFWTKDPTNIIEKLDLISEYNYYFQITVNGYGSEIERKVPEETVVIQSFKSLASKIGANKTIWRYDPIIITDKIDVQYHYNKFQSLATRLAGYTDRCIISFVDQYKKSERNMKSFNPISANKDLIKEIASLFSEIALKHNLKLETCSEDIDLSQLGITHGKCIDDKLLSHIIGQNIIIQKDKNQREVCGCVTSIDIGAYNTCSHGCLYCYANYSDKAVKTNIQRHNPKSPLLIGEIDPSDKITERKMESYLKNQISLF